MSGASDWVVGVDAGGSHTRALAARPGSPPPPPGAAGGANWTVHGAERCGEQIALAVAGALPAGDTPAALCLAVAGYYPPDHREAAEALAARLWPACPVRIVPDVTAAWCGALGGEPGVVLVSGTGSICYGRDSRGREARAGGWGPLFGDEGSAYAVGVGCLRALAARVDRDAPPGRLGEKVMGRHPELGGSPRDWLRGVYRAALDREQIAGLAVDAAQLAEGGDPDAAAILDAAAAALGDLAAAVAARLGEPGLPLVLQGGLARASRYLRSAVRARAAGCGLQPAEPRFSPLEGALLLAAEAVGGPAGIRALRDMLEQQAFRGTSRVPAPARPAPG